MVIVTFEGFTLPSRYIVQECTVYFENSYQHFTFQPPPDFIPDGKDLKTISYASENLNKLTYYNDSLLPYSMLTTILTELSSQTVYCSGNSATKLLRKTLPLTKIINVNLNYRFKYPDSLPYISCGIDHCVRYCSLAKASYIRKYLKTCGTMEDYENKIRGGTMEEYEKNIRVGAMEDYEKQFREDIEFI